MLLGLLSARAFAAETLLVLGDSLSAGYRMPAASAWPALLNEQWQKANPDSIKIVNASISGDTASQGLARLPALLQQHQPRWVLIEMGGNDGLRGFPPPTIEQDLTTIINQVKTANAQPLLMQIRLPANYGQRYTNTFSAIYPRLEQQFSIPLVPFFMEQVYLKPGWMPSSCIHPTREAQPFIADWMAKQLKPLVSL